MRAAAEADLVVTFYNPRSPGPRLAAPQGAVDPRRAPGAGHPGGRRAQRVPAGRTSRLTTLAGLDPAWVDMMTVVTVGNTATRAIAGRMVTPRGYRWQEAATEEVR